MHQFVSRYGTHYVSAIRYGLRIGVQGRIATKDEAKAQKISMDFKAAFGSFSAEGGAKVDQSETLSAKEIDVVCEATSGGREDGGLLVAQGLEDVHKLLSRAAMGEIKFHVAPLELILKPYWPTVDPKWERTRGLLDPSSFQVPAAFYGVPKGTIVAWHPTREYLKERVTTAGDGSSKEWIIVPPSGWAICNGDYDTPDLTDKFIRGTVAYGSVGVPGGQDKHGHGTHTHTTAATTTTLGLPKGGSAHRQPAGTHTHSVGQSAVPKAGHLPPYVQLVYIMKLDDAP